MRVTRDSAQRCSKKVGMLSSHPVRVRTSISSLFAESCTKGQTSKAGEKVHRPVSFARTNKKSEFDIAFFGRN